MLINIDLNGNETAQQIDDECVLVDLDESGSSAVYFHGTVERIRQFAQRIISAIDSAAVEEELVGGEGEEEKEEEGIEAGVGVGIGAPVIIMPEAPASAWERPGVMEEGSKGLSVREYNALRLRKLNEMVS